MSQKKQTVQYALIVEDEEGAELSTEIFTSVEKAKKECENYEGTYTLTICKLVPVMEQAPVWRLVKG